VRESEPAIRDPLSALSEGGLSVLVLRSGESVYSSFNPGVRPLLELVDWFPAGLEGATVADRVVGGCAALVFASLRVERVLALVGSLAAERVLHDHAIPFEFRRAVPEIRNRDDSDVCPFEKLSREHSSARTLVPAMRARLAELSRRTE
jgi:hypothetical protein